MQLNIFYKTQHTAHENHKKLQKSRKRVGTEQNKRKTCAIQKGYDGI